MLLGHGSPLSDANRVLDDVATAIERVGGYDRVHRAFLQFQEPDFATALDGLVSQGFSCITVMPYFLYSGAHVTVDLPALVQAAAAKYPEVAFTVAAPLGFHRSLVEIAIERIEEAGARANPGNPPGDPAHLTHPLTHPIETESMRLIDERLGPEALNRFSPEERLVVKRVIHATADFDFAEIMRFSPGALKAGMDAIARGASIITDVKMVEAGINAERLRGFGGDILCHVSDSDVAAASEREAITRSAAAMRKVAAAIAGSVVVVGNAPTALKEVLRIAASDSTLTTVSDSTSASTSASIRPALVVGVPVGLVGAEEVKDELMASGLEYVSTIGCKGGSAVAAAIVNALVLVAVGARGDDGH